MEQFDVSYEVKLEAFTGPLDLLLHLIRKHEINIYDIPIFLITKQYLDYIEMMKDLNLSLAGEFLVMASTLLQIKSRMLLPQEESVGEDDEDGEDPRSELVRRLVEYQQYKEAAGELTEQEQLWRQIFHREAIQQQTPVRDVLVEDVSLFDLLDALQDVLARTESEVFVDITPDTMTVQDRINHIIERLESESTVAFSALFDHATNRLVVITTFLALLELVRMRLVRIFQGDLFGPVRISRAFIAGQEDGQLGKSTGSIDSDAWQNGGSNGNGSH